MTVPADTRIGLLVIDLQQNGYQSDDQRGIKLMDDYERVVQGSVKLVQLARGLNIPVIFTQEHHMDSLIDIGRELDGSEQIHCLQGDPMTRLADSLEVKPSDLVVTKRRYSAFFGTDLEILLKALKVNTLILVGALSDVCVHYSFVDAHQHDYHVYVVEECVIGSTKSAQDAALRAMRYLQRNSVISSDNAAELMQVAGGLDRKTSKEASHV